MFSTETSLLTATKKRRPTKKKVIQPYSPPECVWQGSHSSSVTGPVALTTSYNQLFFYHWNTIRPQINQKPGYVYICWLPSLCVMTGCFLRVVFTILDSCWRKRSPKSASARDWKRKTDVIFPFLKYRLRLSCVLVSLYGESFKHVVCVLYIPTTVPTAAISDH